MTSSSRRWSECIQSFFLIAVAAATNGTVIPWTRLCENFGPNTERTPHVRSFASCSRNFSCEGHLFWPENALSTSKLPISTNILRNYPFMHFPPHPDKKIPEPRYGPPSRSSQVFLLGWIIAGGICSAGGAATFVAPSRLLPAPPIEQTLSIHCSGNRYEHLRIAVHPSLLS